MRFSTVAIKQNLKTILSAESDFIYLDVGENKMYFSTDSQALCLDLRFEDVTDEKVFVISKSDFLHIASFVDEIELKSNYKYKAGPCKGSFSKNENYVSALDSIKVMFSHSDDYETLFKVDSEILELISRGSIFVNPEDSRTQCQNLDIQDGNIFSSSMFRIYINKFPIDGEGIIHHNVLKFILQLGEGTIVKKNSDSFLLVNEGIAMYFSSLRSETFLPILSEKFQNSYKAVFDTTKIVFSLRELKSKLEFISFYAKKKPSALTHLEIKDGKVSFSVSEENTVNVEAEEIGEFEGSEFVIPFNSVSMLEIISKLSKGVEKVSLYAKGDDSMMIFVLSFSENENVVLSKIKV